MLPAVANPPMQMSLLTAITAMALAAQFHGTDQAVRATAYRMLPKVATAYMPVVLAILNAPSPLKHMNEYVATLPKRVLEMKTKTAPLPLLSLVEPTLPAPVRAVLYRNPYRVPDFDQGETPTCTSRTTACRWPTRGPVLNATYGAILASNVA